MIKQLSFEDFVNIAKDTLVVESVGNLWCEQFPERFLNYKRHQLYYNLPYGPKEDPEFQGIFVEERVASMRPANNYSSRSDTIITPDDDVKLLDLTALNIILEEIVPDISFLTYERIKRMIVEYEYEETDGYGYGGKYKAWAIESKNLYDFLVKRNLILSVPEPSVGIKI